MEIGLSTLANSNIRESRDAPKRWTHVNLQRLYCLLDKKPNEQIHLKHTVAFASQCIPIYIHSIKYGLGTQIYWTETN